MIRPAEVGIVTSCFMVGAGIAGFVGGKLADRIGRKRTLVLFDALFIAFSVCTSLAPTLAFLIVARLLYGFSCGGITISAPVLLAEMATLEFRSQSVSMSLLFIVFGEMCVFIVGAVLGNIWFDTPSIWRWINVAVVVPAVVLLFCHALLVPESPRWLAQNGQPKKAFDTLRRMRKTSLQTHKEFREIQNVIGANSETKANFFDILTVSWVRSIMLVGIGIAFTQQCYGVIIGMMFGTKMLEEGGLDTKTALLGNVVIGVVSFLASWGGLLLVSRVGRRRLLMAGQMGAIGMDILITLCFTLLPYGPARGWLTLALLLIFLTFAQGCISTVTWLLTAEIFPLHLRGICSGIGMSIAWTTACTIAFLFPIGTNSIGMAANFAFLAVVGLIFLIFVWRFLPETRNKTLEVLEQQFQVGDWTALKRVGQGQKKAWRKAANDATAMEVDDDGTERF
uniref:MFS domain-containing protein n=1 Tax=Globodera pallida TaxID=36090 RepID=A0A183C6L5_GLOPA